MPRVADIYQRPPGIDAVTNATIDSSDYNLNVADVETDLNTPRPIVAGGTGATSAAGARDNLDAEVAGKQVTNYDTHVWEAGSFWSQPAATGSPVAGHSFMGTALLYGNPDYVTIEARQMDGGPPGQLYTREKRSGVWGAWISNTLTSAATITADVPVLYLNTTLTTGQAAIVGETNGSPRWVLYVGDQVQETGGNTGSNFSIWRYNDDGVTSFKAFEIIRSSGAMNLTGPVEVTGTLATTAAITAGATSTINGHLTVNGDIFAQRNATQGAISFSSTAGRFLLFTGTQYQLAGGNLSVSNGGLSVGFDIPSGLNSDTVNVAVRAIGSNPVYFQNVNGSVTYGYIDAGGISAGSFYGRNSAVTLSAAGSGSSGQILFRPQGAVSAINQGYYDYAGNLAVATKGYQPGGGAWADSSDLRIKNIVGEYKHGLAELQQVVPVRYTFKGNVSLREPLPGEERVAEHAGVLGKEFVGVIAQDIEKPLPETVTQVEGWIDGAKVEDLRILDPSAITYALVNSCKELAQRVEALEAIVARLK